MLRSAPVYLDQVGLDKIDETLRATAASITNVDMSDQAWQQASLPVRFGGLGLRKAASLALPCYISSVERSRDLVDKILPGTCAFSVDPLAQAEAQLASIYAEPLTENGSQTNHMR